MPFPQSFIVDGRFLGTAMRNLQPVFETLQPPYSYAYFCPHCAELWARCPVTLLDGVHLQQFQVLTIPCRKHKPEPYSQRIPGSLLLAWDKTYNEVVLKNEGTLRYEFQCHINLYPEEAQ